jgi:hypothetical protein
MDWSALWKLIETHQDKQWESQAGLGQRCSCPIDRPGWFHDNSGIERYKCPIILRFLE